jgi:hypothetical protein
MRDYRMMAQLLIAPYLPLREPASLGAWTLWPIQGTAQHETVESESELIPAALRRPVRRLVDAYRVRDEAGIGALVAPRDQEIGVEIDRRSMRPLSRALLAGAVSANPRIVTTEDGSFGGWSIVTAENALLYGHPLSDGDSYAVEVGVIARVLSGRSAGCDEPLPKISPPVELPIPMVSDFDDEIAFAAETLVSLDDT